VACLSALAAADQQCSTQAVKLTSSVTERASQRGSTFSDFD